MNISKCNDLRFWRRWYASGAVPQQQLPGISLSIEAIGKHYAGPAEGCSTLSLGRRVINEGPNGSGAEPVVCVIVPTSAKYRLGDILPSIPANAVPVEVIFPND